MRDDVAVPVGRARRAGSSARAILASRSQAAQLISAELVWTRARVRSSHMPASGVP